MPTALHDLDELARRHPDAIGWRWPDAPSRTPWSFGHAAARIGGVASALLARGLGPGDRLAVVGGNDPAWVLLREAASWLRLVFVPVGPRLSVRERDWLLTNAHPRLATGPADLTLGQHPVLPWEDLVDRDPAPLPERPPPGEEAQLIYTSGSGGRPKGVLRPHTSDVARIRQTIAVYGLRADDRHLVAGPLYHSGPAIFYNVYRRLGAEQLILRHFDPDVVAELLIGGGVDALFMVPTMWRMLLEALRDREARPRLRIAWAAGGPLDPATRAELLAVLGEGVLWEFYGATETGTVTVLPPECQHSHGQTVGFPAPGVDIRIHDAQGRALPPGESGRIYVRSPASLLDYHRGPGSPEDLAVDRHDEYVSVGDRGYLTPEGALVLEGREGGMIISGGVNVHPEEVEDVLRSHPVVREAVVFGVDDPLWGTAVAALVEPERGGRIEVGDLATFLRGEIAGFKVPKRWGVGPIPRTASEKVVRDPRRLSALLRPEA